MENNLNNIRKSMGYTRQDSFAKEVAEVNEKTYMASERGQRHLPIDAAMNIADKANVSLDYVYARSEVASEDTLELTLDIVAWVRELEEEHEFTFSPEGFKKFVKYSIEYVQGQENELSRQEIHDNVVKLFELKAA